MKKRMMSLLLAVCLFCMILPSAAQAARLIDICKERAKQTSSSSSVKKADHNFRFWVNSEGSRYAQWERVSGGLKFRAKMENHFPYDSVDAYTFEISAENAYEESIPLKDADGDDCRSLYYTGDRTFKPNTNGYTEYFMLRADEKIRYVKIKLVKYHTDEGTINIDASQQKEYRWKIN